MIAYPKGWSVNIQSSLWSYGKPSSVTDPHGFAVIGNVLTGTGLYPEPVTGNNQIISTNFSTMGYSFVELSFDRFLGIQSDDVVSIHTCLSGTCVLLWNNTGTIIDTVWTKVKYQFPVIHLQRPAVRVRFGLGPTKKNNTIPTSSFGWNIKNVKVYGAATKTTTTNIPSTTQGVLTCVKKGCVYKFGDLCQCDTYCVMYGDCCGDYYSTCTGSHVSVSPTIPTPATTTTVTTTTTKLLCSNKGCGVYIKSDVCQCDTYCNIYKDCCSDYSMIC